MTTTQTETRPKPERIRLSRRSPYVSLISQKLLDKQRAPGDPISEKEWARLAPNVQQALLGQGRVGKASALPAPTPQQARASKAVKAAQARLTAAQKLHADLVRRRDALEVEIADLAKARQPLSLSAVTGDVQARRQIERLREQTVTCEVELADVTSALKQAEREVKTAQDAVHSADASRYALEAERLIESQCKTCAAIQTLVQKQLVLLIRKYEQQQRQFATICGGRGAGQLTSQWRLRSVLDRALGVDRVSSAFRFDDLGALERKIMKDALQRWQREREREVSK